MLKCECFSGEIGMNIYNSLSRNVILYEFDGVSMTGIAYFMFMFTLNCICYDILYLAQKFDNWATK